MKILTSEILQSAPTERPQTRRMESGIKSTLHLCTEVHRVPNFRPFCSTISRFQDIAHFRIFSLTPMLKFQTVIFFFNFGISPIYTISFYSLMTTLFIIKFGPDRMKTGGGVAS